MIESPPEESANHPELKTILGLLLLGILFIFAIGLTTGWFLGKAQLLVGEIGLAVPAYLYIKRKNLSTTEVFRLNPISNRLLLPSIAIAFAVPILSDELDKLISTFFAIPPEIQNILTEPLQITSFSDAVIIFLAAVLLAGFIEEMLFRGLLQQALERRFDITNALMLTAVFFALFHVVPWWFVQIVLLGVVLGFLAWRSNSIIPGVMLHCVNNALALLFINLPQQSLDWYYWGNHVNPPIIVLAVCAAFYGLKWFYKLSNAESRET